jgi:hypothetical protein
MICLPASLQLLHEETFARSEVRHITIEVENATFSILSNFSIRWDFLIDFESVRAIRYLGADPSPTLSVDVSVSVICI